MKRGLPLSLALMLFLASAAFAGETSGPPCAPGQTDTPPCSQSVTGGSTDPGETNAPPASSVDVIGLAEIALESLLLL